MSPRNTKSKFAAFSLFLAIAATTALATFLATRTPAANANTVPILESFYIVTQAAFRDGPAWVDHILEVRPQGADVLVREVRIAPLAPDCPHHVTLRAIEKVLPSTTVQRLAGKLELCAHAEDDVDGMIHAAKLEDAPNIDDPSTQTIIAVCGGEKRMFELPYPETLRFDALTLANAHVAKYWEIAANIEADAFGSDFSLAKLTPAQDQTAQELGAKILPEIKSGRYKQGFADADCPYAECRDHSVNSALQGYSGPIFTCPKN